MDTFGQATENAAEDGAGVFIKHITNRTGAKRLLHAALNSFAYNHKKLQP